MFIRGKKKLKRKNLMNCQTKIYKRKIWHDLFPEMDWFQSTVKPVNFGTFVYWAPEYVGQNFPVPMKIKGHLENLTLLTRAPANFVL